MFHEGVKDVAREFLGSFLGFPDWFKGVLENVQGGTKKLHVAWHLSQQPEQKEGWFFYPKFQHSDICMASSPNLFIWLPKYKKDKKNNEF